MIQVCRRWWRICPAGLYSMNDQEEVSLTIDGCLECGTCRLVCGSDIFGMGLSGRRRRRSVPFWLIISLEYLSWVLL